MMSYWGVDHGVSKSYLGRGKWAPATKAGKEVLRRAQGAHSDPKAKARTALINRQQKADIASRASRSSGAPFGSTRTRRGAQVLLTRGTGTKSTTAQVGGRRGQRIISLSPQADQTTLRHELAHASPKRSSYRLAQISNNERKIGGEEARAVAMAGHPRRFQYPGSANGTEFGRGFRDVARKIERARGQR